MFIFQPKKGGSRLEAMLAGGGLAVGAVLLPFFMNGRGQLSSPLAYAALIAPMAVALVAIFLIRIFRA